MRSRLTNSIAAWRHEWLLDILSRRIATADLEVQGLLLWIALHADDEGTSWSKINSDLRRHRGDALQAYLAFALDDEATERLASQYGVNLGAEWSELQRTNPRPIQLYEFLDLHNTSELDGLAVEWRLDVARARTRNRKILNLIERMDGVALPRSVAPVRKTPAPKVCS